MNFIFLRYLFTRCCLFLPVITSVILLVSILIHIVPGDPADFLLGEYATLNDKNLLRKQLGLNLPLYQQIYNYISNFLIGDFGSSLVYNRSVQDLLAERFIPTLELACFSICIAILISIPLGILSAIYKDRFLDLFSMTVSLLGVAIPNFWLGPMLIILFAVQLHWLPVSERGGFSSYILPAITLGTSLASILCRFTRNCVLEQLNENYVRTAKAKGCKPYKVLFHHILRNTSLPLLSILGLQFGVLLTGVVITEKIFDWPGIGTLMIESIMNRDYPVIQGCIIFSSIIYLSINLITDILYAYFDPRIKLNQ